MDKQQDDRLKALLKKKKLSPGESLELEHLKRVQGKYGKYIEEKPKK